MLQQLFHVKQARGEFALLAKADGNFFEQLVNLVASSALATCYRQKRLARPHLELEDVGLEQLLRLLQLSHLFASRGCIKLLNSPSNSEGA